MNKIKMAVVSCGLALATGCATEPVVCFKSSSAPVPAQGYTVIGSDVEGTSDQLWVLGIGGDVSKSHQHTALKQALGKAVGADALVGMTIDTHHYGFVPFFWVQSTRVTGTPVKFK